MSDPGDEMWGHDDYPNECQRCGGEGYVFECFDGFCKECDVGCDDCTRACPDCTKRPASDELRQVLADALKQTPVPK